MTVFDFQTETAVILATASFRHLRPAFCRRTSEQILSDSLDFVICIEMFFNLWKAGKLCPPNRHSPVFALVGGLFHSSIYDRNIITPELYQFLLTEEGLNKTCCKHLIKKTSPSEVRGCLIIIWTGLTIQIGIIQKAYE